MMKLGKVPLLGGLLSFAVVTCLSFPSWAIEGIGERAAETMEKCLYALGEEAESRGFSRFSDSDIYGTGLVGEEFTPLTTTLGELEDKRTSFNPLFAAGVAGTFSRLGLMPGDRVAIGASGSFPGLLIAVLSACRAMELRPLLICSLGSSMYGANRPGFTVVDMVKSLSARELVSVDLLGFSLGGGGDRGLAPLFPEWDGALMAEARRLEENLILEEDLTRSVAARIALFEMGASGDPIGCFVGVGGAGVTFGTGDGAASFPTGLSWRPFPGMPDDGLLSRFLTLGTPVVHLLCVRKLCDMWSIPYDGDPFLWRR